MFFIIQKIYIMVTKKKGLFLPFRYILKNLAKIVIFKIKNLHTWMFATKTDGNIDLGFTI